MSPHWTPREIDHLHRVATRDRTMDQVAAAFRTLGGTARHRTDLAIRRQLQIHGLRVRGASGRQQWTRDEVTVLRAMGGRHLLTEIQAALREHCGTDRKTTAIGSKLHRLGISALPDPSVWMRLGEAARLLGVTPISVINMIERGELEATRTSTRRQADYRIAMKSLIAMADRFPMNMDPSVMLESPVRDRVLARRRACDYISVREVALMAGVVPRIVSRDCQAGVLFAVKGRANRSGGIAWWIRRDDARRYAHDRQVGIPRGIARAG